MGIVLFPSAVQTALGTHRCKNCGDALYVTGPSPTLIVCLGCQLHVELPDDPPENTVFNELLKYLDIEKEPSGIEG